MIGILPSTEVENNYHERLTHSNVLLTALVLIPDDEQLSSNEYIDEMKSLSQIFQESFSRQQPHGVKHFLANLMEKRTNYYVLLHVPTLNWTQQTKILQDR